MSGQYPGKYIIPNKLDIVFKIRQKDPSNFGDTILALLHGKSDVEYFKTLLDTFQWLHSKEDYESLLSLLPIPNEVREYPFYTQELCSLTELWKYLDTVNETDFSRYVVMPILHAMGYKEIEYKWKVNETDYGNDFYPMEYKSPSGLIYYAWIQTKATKMSDWDTSAPWGELNKLISEAKTAFSQMRKINTWKEVTISEYLIFNSRHVPEGVKDKFFQDQDLKWKSVRFYWKDWILSLVMELKLPKDFYK